jgi:hypothetical protein
MPTEPSLKEAGLRSSDKPAGATEMSYSITPGDGGFVWVVRMDAVVLDTGTEPSMVMARAAALVAGMCFKLH